MVCALRPISSLHMLKLIQTSLLSIAFLLTFSTVGSVSAQRSPKRVQPPPKEVSRQRILAVKKARSQRVKPTRAKEVGTSIHAAIVAGSKISDPRIRQQLAIAPLSSRLTVFKKSARSLGLEVPTFTRRLRGMVQNGKTNRATTASKIFLASDVLMQQVDALARIFKLKRLLGVPIRQKAVA